MLPHERRPDDLAGDMKYRRDDPIGDGRRFHFYAYYRDEAATLPIDASFHHEWIITGTDWDPAAERGEEGALEASVADHDEAQKTGRTAGVAPEGVGLR